MRVDTFPAGRDLDYLVGQDVMGLQCYKSSGGLDCPLHRCPHYSTDMTAAWSVLEKLGPISSVFAQPDGTYCAQSGDLVTAVADTGPLAICRLAMAVKTAPPPAKKEDVKVLSVDFPSRQGTLDMTLKHPDIVMLAATFVKFFKEEGGVNYVEFKMMDPSQPGLGLMSVLIQRVAGITPAEKASLFREALEGLVDHNLCIREGGVCATHFKEEVCRMHEARKLLEAHPIKINKVVP